MIDRRRDGVGGGRLSERKGYVSYNYLFTSYLDLAPLSGHPRLLFVCLYLLFFVVYVAGSLFSWFLINM